MRLADMLKRAVAPLCTDRYTWAPEANYLDISGWTRRVVRKWKRYDLSGPQEVPGWDWQDYFTPLELAWMLQYDQHLQREVHGCGADSASAALWPAITIQPAPWRVAGQRVYEMFRYGTDCPCCLGYRLVALAGTAAGLGWLLGVSAC
jgi:hypothetical protein